MFAEVIPRHDHARGEIFQFLETSSTSESHQETTTGKWLTEPQPQVTKKSSLVSLTTTSMPVYTNVSKLLMVKHTHTSQTTLTALTTQTTLKPTTNETQEEYAVNTPSCKIPKLDPLDPRIKKLVDITPLAECAKTSMLTYQEEDIIKVNVTYLQEKFSNMSIKCEYQYILWKENDNFQLSDAIQINLEKGYFKMTNEFVQVTCYAKDSNPEKIVYRHFHSKFMKQNLKKLSTTRGKNEWNVMLIGTDSMARSATVRYMPRTVKYLTEKLKAIDLQGYTKVGLNTSPNMFPLMTGYHLGEILKPKERLNYLPLLFKNYSMKGYATFFGEDWPSIGMFNYLLPGFGKKPTDYYLHPFTKAVTNAKNWTQSNCERKIFQPQKMLDYLEEFAGSYKNTKHFSFFFTTIVTHDYNTDARKLDHLYPKFFEKLDKNGIFQDTILMFFGDHGARYGSVMSTFLGKMEGRLPAMFIVFPEKFRQRYPEYIKNIQINRRRLTTPFDIYATLQHILNIDEASPRNEPRSISLFNKIPADRTCESASIDLQFCPCLKEIEVDCKLATIQKVGKYIVSTINNILNDSMNICAELSLEQLHSAYMLKSPANKTSDIHAYEHYRVTLSTLPGQGLFEGTVSLLTGEDGSQVFEMQGPIARLNIYGNTSICVENREKRLYCYCKSNLNKKKTL